MNAFKIDVINRVITEVEYTKSEEICPHLSTPHKEARLFTVVTINEERDGIFVDDEGLYTHDEENYCFKFEGYPQPLCGNGLILGDDGHGDSCTPAITLAELKEKITFLGKCAIEPQRYGFVIVPINDQDFSALRQAGV